MVTSKMIVECDVCNSVFHKVEDLIEHQDAEHNMIESYEEDLHHFVDNSAASDYHCSFVKSRDPWPDDLWVSEPPKQNEAKDLNDSIHAIQDAEPRKAPEPIVELKPIVIDHDVNENGSLEAMDQSLDLLDSKILSDKRFHFTIQSTICQRCGKTFSCQSSLDVHMDLSRCSGIRQPKPERKRPNLRSSTLSRQVKYIQPQEDEDEEEDEDNANDNDFEDVEPVREESKLLERNAGVRIKNENRKPKRKGKENSFEVHCDLCDRDFPCLSKLIRHESQVHKEERPFHCKVCGSGFKAKNHLVRHEKLHLRPLLSCEQCPKEFPTALLLNRHVYAEHKLFSCDICVKVFKSGKYLHQHNQTFHPKKKDDKRHLCSICNKPLASQLLKKIHESTHSTDRPFHCDECDKTFKYLRNLNDHKATVHKAARPFSCYLCQEAFKRKSHLLTHLRLIHPS